MELSVEEAEVETSVLLLEQLIYTLLRRQKLDRQDVGEMLAAIKRDLEPPPAKAFAEKVLSKIVERWASPKSSSVADIAAKLIAAQRDRIANPRIGPAVSARSVSATAIALELARVLVRRGVLARSDIETAIDSAEEIGDDPEVSRVIARLWPMLGPNEDDDSEER